MEAAQTARPVRKEFQVHMLNDQGKELATTLAYKFSVLLNYIQEIGEPGPELTIVARKLEEASFYAKKAMASKADNQQ